MFGVFTDEGIVADDFFTSEEAHAWVANNLSDDDEGVVLECCPDHPEHARETCVDCVIGDGEE